jgi:hypothetical protein
MLISLLFGTWITLATGLTCQITFRSCACSFAAFSPRFHSIRVLLPPLQALPILGTRYGGCSHSAGVVLCELLPRVLEAATVAEVDVAIVTNEPEAYAAAQVGCCACVV